MMFAICINCGAKKKKPEQRCPKCSLVPRTDEEKAKSLVLSTYFELDGEYRGKSQEELMEAAKQIEAGEFQFDENEVALVIAYARRVLSIPASRLIGDLIRWMGPPILILLALFLLLRIKHG